MVGNAGHGHPADRLAAFLAGEGELQHPGEFHRVFKEALEEIAEAVEQHPLGMLGLELHVVAQHWREPLRVHLAVVGPGRRIAGVVVCSGALRSGDGVVGVGFFALLALAGPGGGIGAEAGVREVGRLVGSWANRRGSRSASRFRSPEQTALEGLRLGSGSGARH